MNTTLYFTHGNGFPSGCYNRILEPLRKQFTVYQLDRIGHNPEFPVTENWEMLVREVIHSVRSQAHEPVIAIGHSLGGVLNLLAAIEEPTLFRGVIMLDSPLLGRVKSRIVRLAKTLGVIDVITPAGRTRARRASWESRDEVVDYLRSRPLFRHFTDACLEDYILHGMVEDETGFRLAFDPDTEYRIFRTIPHTLPQHEGRLMVPGILIWGDESNVVRGADRRYMQKHFGIPSVSIHGSHMFPMENPQLVLNQLVAEIHAILQR